MTPLAAVVCGALVGVGLFTVVLGLQNQPVREKQHRLRKFRARATRIEVSSSMNDTLAMIGLAAVLGFGAWYATGWLAAGVIGLTAGVMGPMMFRAPRRRRDFTDEVEAYSQWTEQIRDLVSASGSLFEAVTLSADQAPLRLRPKVVQMASIARTLGLPPALDWFAAEMNSPFADRLVLGMKIAWDSGARVSEAFDSTARAMRTEVEMRRRNEVANARAWTQVISMVGVTVVSVLFMFVFNKEFFDPFGSMIGQAVLLGVGALIFGNVYWVLKLSESGTPVRLLASQDDRLSEGVLAALTGKGD
ncbi:MAG: type II secretion system F family protein [Acidimicrobiaceae bacterium]|nr:type II secretion system F family protein [Acidimicrobiaceae bacterium]